MSLKERIHEVENQIVDKRENDCKIKCYSVAQDIRRKAVKEVEDAIYCRRYDVKTKGFFKNRKTIKSVSGRTHTIEMHYGWPSPTPDTYRSDGSTDIIVGNKKEFDLLIECITKELEQEGFVCSTDKPEYGRGIYIKYTMEWE